MKLTILGSASGYPTAKRSSSGYILDVDGQLVLFDCGSGVTRAFLQSELDPNSVSTIIISHTDPDHIADLPQFVQMLKLSRKKGRLDIYLPGEAIDAISNYLNACYLFREKLPFSLELKAVADSWNIENINMTIRSVLNRHLTGNAGIIEEFEYPNKMQSYSYLIEHENKRLFYSGDIKSFDDVRVHLHDLDLLLIETSHIDLESTFESLSESNVKKIVLTHIADEKEPALKNIVSRNKYELNMTIARDGDVIEI